MYRLRAFVGKASKVLTPHFGMEGEIEMLRAAPLERRPDGTGTSREDRWTDEWRKRVETHREVTAVLGTLDEDMRNTLRLAFGPDPHQWTSDYTILRGGGFDFPSVALTLPVVVAGAKHVKQNPRTFLRGLVLGKHLAIKGICTRKMHEYVEVAASYFVEAWDEREKKK